jgi:hypothetical protein
MVKRIKKQSIATAFEMKISLESQGHAMISHS